MNRAIVILMLSVVTFPFYIVAYGISKLFRLKDNENMPTVAEWLLAYREELEEVEVL